MAQRSPGKLFLIGAGPGDPELLTLKAARVLRECDVVLYDRLVSREILAFARPDAELVYVGKHEGEQEHTQGEIFAHILRLAAEGKRIARLKGGDPLVFGRGGEEWALAIEHGIDFELVPGVTSSIAAPGLAGIPLTYRRISQSFAVITGHCHQGLSRDWSHYAGLDTLVILMGVKNRSEIARALIEAGRPAGEPVAFVYRGSLPDQVITESTLDEVAKGGVVVRNPAVFVIGRVVRLRTQLLPVISPEQHTPSGQIPKPPESEEAT